MSTTLLRWAVSLGAGIALAGGLSLAAWFALSDGPARAPRTVELVIPAGTASRVQAGAFGPRLPASFVAGDTLVLRNEDSVEHRVGPYRVSPGVRTEVPLARAGSQSLLCTFHPQGIVGLTVRAGGNPLVVLWPTFLLGLPLGAVLGAVWTVLSRLDPPDDGTRTPGARPDAV